jgi:hypothetical protein
MKKVFVKLVGQKQKEISANNVADIRKALNLGSDTAICCAKTAEVIGADVTFKGGEYFMANTKTEGSGEVIFKINDGELAITKEGNKYIINGVEVTPAKFLKLINAYLDAEGYSPIKL